MSERERRRRREPHLQPLRVPAAQQQQLASPTLSSRGMRGARSRCPQLPPCNAFADAWFADAASAWLGCPVCCRRAFYDKRVSQEVDGEALGEVRPRPCPLLPSSACYWLDGSAGLPPASPPPRVAPASVPAAGCCGEVSVTHYSGSGGPGGTACAAGSCGAQAWSHWVARSRLAARAAAAAAAGGHSSIERRPTGIPLICAPSIPAQRPFSPALQSSTTPAGVQGLRVQDHGRPGQAGLPHEAGRADQRPRAGAAPARPPACWGCYETCSCLLRRVCAGRAGRAPQLCGRGPACCGDMGSGSALWGWRGRACFGQLPQRRRSYGGPLEAFQEETGQRELGDAAAAAALRAAAARGLRRPFRAAGRRSTHSTWARRCHLARARCSSH